MDVAIGTVLAFLYRFLGMIFLALVSVITARELSVEDRGVFVAAVVIISAIGSLVASFSSATGYFVSNKNRPPGEVAFNATILSLLMGLVVFAVCFALWVLLRPGLLPFADDIRFFERASNERQIILLIGFSLFPMVARHALGGVSLGLNHQGRYSFSIYGPSYTAVFLFVFWFILLDHRSAESAIALWILSQYASLIVQAAIGWNWWSWALHHRPDFGLIRDFLTFGTVTGLAGFVSYFNYRIDQILVFTIDGSRGSGIYATAVNFAEGLWLFSTALSISAFARVGSLDRENAAELTARSVRHTLLMSASAGAAIFVLAPYLIEGVFGARYLPATESLRILTVGTVLWAPAAILSNYFSIQLGRPSIPLFLALTSCTINVIVSSLLIPQYGFKGAAWGTTISYSFTIILTSIVFLRMSDAHHSDLWRIRKDDILSYFRLANRILHGELFRHFLPGSRPAA